MDGEETTTVAAEETASVDEGKRDTAAAVEAVAAAVMTRMLLLMRGQLGMGVVASRPKPRTSSAMFSPPSVRRACSLHAGGDGYVC